MIQTFPPLIEGFLKLLIRLGQRNQSISASKPGSKFLLNSFDQFLYRSSEMELSSSSLPLEKKYSKSKLIDMTWLDFNKNIMKKLSPEESLSLAIQKTFAMVCQLNSLNRIYRDKTI